MIFSRWFRRRRPRPNNFFRPAVCLLEDRTVPSGGWHGHYSPGPATHFQVITPEEVQSGNQFSILVEAEDASNHLAAGYTGTVHFSLKTSDSGATVPADFTFSKHDHGFHRFRFTLSALGDQSIIATDTATSSITGSASTTVVPAPATTQFDVRIAPVVLSGGLVDVTVVAQDVNGHRTRNYTGTVSFGSSDGNMSLPFNYQFVAADHGRHTFQISFQTAGSQTFTVTDTTNSSITGQASVNVDDAATTVLHFDVFAFPFAKVGSAAPFGVAVVDASDNVVAGYSGTVRFTSSDSKVTLPDYTFTDTDNGFHLFAVTFAATGKQTLTVTDIAANSITGSVNFWVLSHFWHRH